MTVDQLPRLYDAYGWPMSVGQQVTILDFRIYPETESVGWNSTMVPEIGRVTAIASLGQSQGEVIARLSYSSAFTWRGIWLRGHHPAGLKHLVLRYQKEVHHGG